MIGSGHGALVSTNELSRDTQVVVDHEKFVAFDKRTLPDGGVEVYLVGMVADGPLEVSQQDLDEPMWEVA